MAAKNPTNIGTDKLTTQHSKQLESLVAQLYQKPINT